MPRTRFDMTVSPEGDTRGAGRHVGRVQGSGMEKLKCERDGGGKKKRMTGGQMRGGAKDVCDKLPLVSLSGFSRLSSLGNLLAGCQSPG